MFQLEGAGVRKISSANAVLKQCVPSEEERLACGYGAQYDAARRVAGSVQNCQLLCT